MGYGPPPEKYQERINKTVQGIDTYKVLAAAYAEDPKNIEAVFKLAQKIESRLNQDKAITLYKEVLALDPDGKKGTFERDYDKAKIAYTEYAEYSIAQMSAFGRQVQDPSGLKNFIQKYPQSPLLKTAYMYLSSYYNFSPKKEDALAFYKEYTAKYPDDLNVLNSFVTWTVRNKSNIDGGIALAEKIQEMTKNSPRAAYVNNLAQLYALKGDKAKAEAVYGKSFLEGRLSSLPFDLISYASFWNDQNDNIESVEKAIDAAVKLSPDSMYILQQAATIFVKLGKVDKALLSFGPSYVDLNKGNANNLGFYARFWSGKSLNLDSALDAAMKAVALAPSAAYYDALSGVYLKMKNYPEALKAAEKAVETGGERAAYYKGKIDNIKKQMENKEGT